VRSAVYEGVVAHRRLAPVAHEFRYRIAMPYVDLDEVDELCSRHPLWSARGPNAVWFRRADFLTGTADPADPNARDPGGSLGNAVRDLVEASGRARPQGPIGMLAHLRTWGWLFNPVTLYFCFDAGGAQVDALVAEVTNTPWHERHAYVLGPIPGPAPVAHPDPIRGPPLGQYRFPKALHVSPFMGMDQEYVLGCDAPGHRPGDRLVVRLASIEAGEKVFEATLALRRCEATRRELGRLMWSYPLMTWRVSTAIQRQALNLWRKGAPFHPHPSHSAAGRAVRATSGSTR
jgi:uncharacterized protein